MKKNKILALIIILTIPYLKIHSQDSLYRQSSGIFSDLSKVYFYNQNVGWATGRNGIIIKTNDAGVNWSLKDTTKDLTLTSLFFLDSIKGWSVGTEWSSFAGKATLLKTIDGGNNWQSNSLDCHLPNGIWFTDSDNGWLICRDYYILKTTDGGISWQKKEYFEYKSMESIFFIDKDYGWISGEDFVLRTTDSGINWEYNSVGIPHTLNLHSLYFVNKDVGWVVGFYLTDIYSYRSIIYKTSDGGVTWDEQKCNSKYHLHSVHFVSDQSGWAVGEFGTILRTIDGGENWNLIKNITYESLNSVYFANEATGWIVGANGTIYHTRNSGLSFIEGESINNTIQQLLTYPNPFNNSTVLNFHLSELSYVKLEIYSLLGKLISTLIDGVKPQGEYKIRWNPNNISSGVYISRLQIDNELSCKKMIYQK